MKSILILLFAVKPFIDLTWDVHLFNVFGAAINPLELVGFLVFIITGMSYLFSRPIKYIFNERLIWLFIIINMISMIIAIIYRGQSIISASNVFIKITMGRKTNTKFY